MAGAPGSMLPLGEAVRRVLAGATALESESIPLIEADDRVLARDVVAPVNLPPWANAAMDGYAVRRGDIADAAPDRPTRLTVRETVAAGGAPTSPLETREAVRIMTGAPVPDGCDTVVRVEDTDGGIAEVVITNARDVGRNVRARGEDLREGAVAVPARTVITPAWLGILAAAGAATVDVPRRPRVAILASGDELATLADFVDVRAGHRIVSTNSWTLGALVRSCGATLTDLGIVADTPDAWRDALAGADQYDLLITTGGVSVGAFDHARSAMAARGFTLDFWRVRVRPASQTAFGHLGETRWIGMPGNPVSAMVAFELFARPLLRRWFGHARPFRRTMHAVLAETVHAPGTTAMLYRVVVTAGGAGLGPAGVAGAPVAHLTGPQGTGVLTSMGRANALLHVPEGVTTLAAGSTAVVLPLDDSRAFADTNPLDA